MKDTGIATESDDQRSADHMCRTAARASVCAQVPRNRSLTQQPKLFHLLRSWRADAHTQKRSKRARTAAAIVGRARLDPARCWRAARSGVARIELLALRFADMARAPHESGARRAAQGACTECLCCARASSRA